jgi:predicted component of viral defense system (DUF524 family)
MNNQDNQSDHSSGGAGFGVRVQRLFKVHSREIFIIGALVVFITFVVKDAVRENLKDLVDSINSAEDAYRNSTESARISKEVVDVELQVEEFKRASDPTGPVTLTAVVAGKDVAATTESLLRNLENLNEHLPTRKDLQPSLSEHKKNLASLVEQLQSIDSSLHGTGEAPTTLIQLRSIESAIWREYWLYILPTGEKLLAQAESIKERRERNYKICTIVSYVLYVLGWTLAFVGHLAGLEVPGADG